MVLVNVINTFLPVEVDKVSEKVEVVIFLIIKLPSNKKSMKDSPIKYTSMKAFY